MTTGRINQITILKQCRSAVSPRRYQERAEQGSQVCKRLYVLAATTGSRAPASLKDMCFHDLQPTRARLIKRKWLPKYSLRDEFFGANLLPPGRSSSQKQDLLTVDWQTLFTHNHTIICCSLGEGLTYSCCAYHALARGHKKYDCSYEGSSQVMLSESFKCFFAVTVLDKSNQNLALLAHIYGKVAICKSCERSRRR